MAPSGQSPDLTPHQWRGGRGTVGRVPGGRGVRIRIREGSVVTGMAQSSTPVAPSSAVKKIRSPDRVKLEGDDEGFPGTMS